MDRSIFNVGQGFLRLMYFLEQESTLILSSKSNLILQFLILTAPLFHNVVQPMKLMVMQ